MNRIECFHFHQVSFVIVYIFPNRIYCFAFYHYARLLFHETKEANKIKLLTFECVSCCCMTRPSLNILNLYCMQVANETDFLSN